MILLGLNISSKIYKWNQGNNYATNMFFFLRDKYYLNVPKKPLKFYFIRLSTYDTLQAIIMVERWNIAYMGIPMIYFDKLERQPNNNE